MPIDHDQPSDAIAGMDHTALERALALRDLTDSATAVHAVQLVVDRVENALTHDEGLPVRRYYGPRVVAVADNYDRLRYPADTVTRAVRYTRYVDAGRMLRSHTTAAIPGLLDQYANGVPVGPEVLLSVPGICYRRDVIDRTHVGEPHQHDLWRIRRAGTRLNEADLLDMVNRVVGAVLPNAVWRCPPSEHPYTLAGREILVTANGTEVEIGECGLAHPDILTRAGLPPDASGLAMGLGLDRLTMLAKGIDDIRLLRATDSRVAAQMADLSPYRMVSTMPATARDLSLIVADDLDGELLGDRVRAVLGADADAVEQVLVLAETGYADLPDAACDRTGIRADQKNLLLRIVLRDLTTTLTAADASALRDRVYAGLHEGERYEWSTR